MALSGESERREGADQLRRTSDELQAAQQRRRAELSETVRPPARAASSWPKSRGVGAFLESSVRTRRRRSGRLAEPKRAPPGEGSARWIGLRERRHRRTALSGSNELRRESASLLVHVGCGLAAGASPVSGLGRSSRRRWDEAEALASTLSGSPHDDGARNGSCSSALCRSSADTL